MQRRMSILSAALLALLSATADETPLRAGVINKEVRCQKAADFSYLLYLPSEYTPARAAGWPVLFVMGPDGGTEEGIGRYVKGAELNGWIVAMSMQARDGYDRPLSAVGAMVEDVIRRLEVDERRCYAGGMGTGARLAFRLANRKPELIIGILPCGAGDFGNRYDTRALAYGLCGAYCYSRWDMTITFEEHIRERGRLRYFEGGHLWADENLMLDAMTWLNGKYLSQKGTPEEIDRFSEKLFNLMTERYESDPYFVYETARVLAEIRNAPHAESAQRIADKLAEDPRIQLYVQGLAAVRKFANRHFNTEVEDFKNNRLTKRQVEEAENLSALYGETPLGPVIRGFAMPSKRF